MACVNPDGTISESARAMIRVMQEPADPTRIADQASLPMFRVRSGLRELVEAGLVEERHGTFVVTDLGRQRGA